MGGAVKTFTGRVFATVGPGRGRWSSSGKKKAQRIDSIGQLDLFVIIRIGSIKTAGHDTSEKEVVQDGDRIGQVNGSIVIAVAAKKARAGGGINNPVGEDEPFHSAQPIRSIPAADRIAYLDNAGPGGQGVFRGPAAEDDRIHSPSPIDTVVAGVAGEGVVEGVG